ncbi:MAG TPA: 50S ribosomal protein L25 [Phycisphaerae bacterium]|nr:50S ribosomal protein L25 [Phycisphaerae bacterium]
MTKLQGRKRRAHGTREANRLRRQGGIPGIIYGHGQDPVPVVVSAEDVKNMLAHHSPMIELTFEGQPTSVLIKAVQFDSFGIHPIHIDFMRVDANERVKVKVALLFKGTPVGVQQEGGIFEEQLVNLEVETLAGSIPGSIRVDVAHLEIGQSIHVKDIVLPEGVKAITPPDTIVCTVRAKVVAEEVAAAPAEESPTQPEIITARRPEEGEEERDKDKKKK